MNTQTVSEEKLRRLEQLIEAATKVFLERGYRRTTMADIAREMSVAPGTLYLYVAGKEALFDMTVRRHLGLATQDELAKARLPLATTGPAATLAVLEERLRADSLTPSLLRALKAGSPSPSAAAELRGVINELYDMMGRYRIAIKLMERSALDWPELEGVFVKLRRSLRNNLTTYLLDRSAAGAFAAVGSPRVVANFIIDYVASFSMQQMQDLRPPVSEEEGRQVCINMLMRALLP